MVLPLLFFLRDHKFEVVSQTRDYFTMEISDAALTHDVHAGHIYPKLGWNSNPCPQA